MKKSGIILCGGESSRMGRAKAWLLLGGETLFARSVRTLSPVVSGIVISAAPGQELPPVGVPYQRVDDAVPGGGPLPAMAGALRCAAGQGFSDAFVQAVDMPFVSSKLVEYCFTQLRADDQAVIPVARGVRQPLCGVYRTQVGGAAELMAASGERSLQRLLDSIANRLLTQEDWGPIDPEGRSFRSINTPQDYAALLGETPVGF